jgi:hypothetical protein
MRTTRKPQPGSKSWFQLALFPQATLTAAVLPTSRRRTLKASRSATSSPALADGRTRLRSRVGRSIEKSGPAVALVSRSVVQAKDSERKTKDTCGPYGSISSASVALQQSLASKLQARLHLNGSMEYSLTWKDRLTPAGRQICALRASTHRTSDSAYTGWPTCQASDGIGGANSNRENRPQTGGPDLGEVAKLARVAADVATGFRASQQIASNSVRTVKALAGWSSPTAQDGRRGDKPPRPQDTGVPLDQMAVLAGWTTPQSKEPTAGSRPNRAATGRTTEYLGRQVLGTISTSSHAQTANRGALNPAHSRWLMGYPVEWDSCGAMAMQSFQNSRRNLSKHT